MSTPSLASLEDGGVARVLELARRHLGMDVAFLAEFTDGKQVYRGLDGAAASFGWRLDDGPPLPDTYCRLMTAGEIPNAISDAKADSRVNDLAVTADADIGAYIGVPVRLPDGTLYGSLCCLSHDPTPLHARDVSFLSMLGELVEDEVAAQRREAAARARILDLMEHARVDIALQPIVDLNDGHTLGLEALSRFPAGAGAPDVVFSEAHELGLGGELERASAAAAIALMPYLTGTEYLAINATPAAAFDLAARAARTPDVPYDRLVLEITEHEAIGNYAALRDTLAQARAAGLRLAIDDAGAGYASLQHIIELQPDIIKIDRCLVDGVSHNLARRSAVKAFVALAQELNAVVVAEGVEEHADLVEVRNLGIGAAQGYLLARPSTDRADVARWIDRPFLVA